MMMEIDQFSHEHRLVLKEEEHKHGIGDDDGGDIQTFRRCNGCLDPISSSLLGGAYYSCVNNECDFFLHKLCAELPSEINHPLHPEHKLFLFGKRSCVMGAIVPRVISPTSAINVTLTST
ncbi:hypothetical protein LguiA_024516 [Lonicera macranthoides]